MKKIVIILVLLAVAFFGVLIIAANNADKLIATAKPTLESIASNALGSAVKLGEIKTKIFPETAIEIESVKVDGNKAIPALSVDNLLLKVSLLPLIKGNLVINELLLRNPSVTIEKSDNLPDPKESTKDKKINTANTTSGTQEPAKNIPITFNLQKFSLERGSINLTEANVRIDDINVYSGAKIEDNVAQVSSLKATGKISGQPFRVDIENASFNLSTQLAKLNSLVFNLAGIDGNFSVSTDSSLTNGDYNVRINAGSLDGFYNLIKSIKTDFNNPPFNIRDVNFNILGKINNRNIGFSSDNSSVSVNNAPIQLAFKGTANDKQITASGLEVKAYSGVINAPLTLALKPVINLKSELDVATVSLHELIQSLAPQIPLKVFGVASKVSGKLDATVSDNPLATTNGNFTYTITDGGLKDINILGNVINALSSIPIIGDSLQQKLPPAVLAEAKSPDTRFSSLTGSVNISNGKAAVNNTVLQAELFNVNASGLYGLTDQSMSFNTTVILKPSLVAALINAGKDFEKLRETDGTILVPVKIQKQGDSIQIIPDVEKLTKSAAGKVLKEQAGKALEKAFGSKNKGTAQEVGRLLGF